MATVKTVYTKLAEARVEVASKIGKKSGANKFAGFTYFELGDILPAILEAQVKFGLCSQVTMQPSEGTATLIVYNSEKPEEQIAFSVPTAEIEMKGCNKIQAIGAVITYVRRYLYMNAFEIIENDALDAVAGSPMMENKKSTKESISTSEIQNMQTIEDVNNCYKLFKKSVSTAWKAPFNYKIRELGFAFDKIEDKFFDPKAVLQGL